MRFGAPGASRRARMRLECPGASRGARMRFGSARVLAGVPGCALECRVLSRSAGCAFGCPVATGVPGMRFGVPGASRGASEPLECPGASRGCQDTLWSARGASRGAMDALWSARVLAGVPGMRSGVARGCQDSLWSGRVLAGVPGCALECPGASRVPGYALECPGVLAGVPGYALECPGASQGVPGYALECPVVLGRFRLDRWPRKLSCLNAAGTLECLGVSRLSRAQLLESSILVLFLWKQLAVSAAVPGRQQSRQFAILDLDTGWWRQAPTFFAGPPVVSMRRARSVYCLLTWFDMAGGQPQLQICSYMNGQPEGFHMLREIPLACRPSPVETALDRLVVTGQQSLLLFTGFSDPQLIGLSASPVRQLHHEIRLLTEEHQADWFAVRILQLERSGQRRRCSQLISVNKESLSILPVTDELPAEVGVSDSRLHRQPPVPVAALEPHHRASSTPRRCASPATSPWPAPGASRQRKPPLRRGDARPTARRWPLLRPFRVGRQPKTPRSSAGWDSNPGPASCSPAVRLATSSPCGTDGPEAGNVWTVADPDCGQAPAGFALGPRQPPAARRRGGGGGGGGGGGVSSACVVVVSEVRRTSGGPLDRPQWASWSQWRFYGDSVKESFAVLFREG
uniref:F-box only protein 15 n=1 Tax=Macrostomum lignano TaxID=282301 RepID=A0A1I8F2F8_9PLAT